MVIVAYRHGLRAAELVDLRCGSRLTSERPPCTSVGSSRARPARIRLQAYLGHKNIQHTVRLTELRRQSIVTAFRPKRPIYAAAKTCV